MPTEELTYQPTDNLKWLHDNLEQKYKFKLRRMTTALRYSAAATVGIIIALLLVSLLNIPNVSPLPQKDQLYAPFYEWVTTEQQVTVGNWYDEITTQVQRLYSNAKLVGASLIAPNQTDSQNDVQKDNIAGIARLCALVAVSITVTSAYRRLLRDYYCLNTQQAELKDFQETPGWEQWISRLFYTSAALFGTYVLVSVLWLGLSSVFKGLELYWFAADLLIAGFVGVVTFAATFGALAVTTRGVLLLGLLVVAGGLPVSFALAPLISGQQWWERAVSSAGQMIPSAPIFTGVLLSGSLAMVVLWFDINAMIHRLVYEGHVSFLSRPIWMLVARVLFTAFVLGLLFVGFIRVDHDHQANSWLHAGGAVSAIASVVMSALLINKRGFPSWYRVFSFFILPGVTVGLAVIGSLNVGRSTDGFLGNAIVSLTTIELVLLMMMGLWLFVTVDNLVTLENINALTGQAKSNKGG